MINKRSPLPGWLAVGICLAVGGCRAARAGSPDPLQGVVELEERVLGFELAGRVERVEVDRGDTAHEGQVIAALDDSLERAARESRASEADAARHQVELLEAGPRSDEIRALSARVRAAKANESRPAAALERERVLLRRGVSTQAAVDDLEARLDAATAERQSLEHRRRALRKGARSQEIDGAKSRATALDKTLKLEEERIARHVLRAAEEGVVLEVHVKRGEVVSPGAPVVTLGDTKHPYVDVFVPLDRLGEVRVGLPAAVRVDSTEDVFSGRVEHVARQTEFTPRYLFSKRERPNLVVRVRIRVEDPGQRLHAGVPAFVALGGGER